MCGFTALLGPSRSQEDLESRLRPMLASLSHRGPDDAGMWFEPETGLALGHRRLSILDLSPAGHQPMVSASGRHVIAYNGEIYNFAELAEELGDITFRGDSDTEVLLAAVEKWGVEGALERAVGMFAFALWDRQEKRLTLARDRMGKKPLYFGLSDNTLVVASELHAFRAWSRAWNVDRGALALLTRFGFIPEPHSIYEGVQKLSPGGLVVFQSTRGECPRLVEERPYYSLENVILAGADARRNPPPEPELLNEVRSTLQLSVRQRMRSDVPLGAFLSGGIDSSLVVALMQASSSQRVKTYSIGFEEKEFNEADAARAVAEHIGTEHTEFIVRQSDLHDLVPEMPHVYDEPFADSSQLPTTVISRLARRHVTVVLTGDGGDEIFCGYNRHIWGDRVYRALRRVPFGMRAHIPDSASGVSRKAIDLLVSRINPLLPLGYRVSQPGAKLEKLLKVAGCETPEAIHLALASYFTRKQHPVLHAPELRTPAEEMPASLSSLEPMERALWFDTVQGLPGDMLVKVDRASMSVGLEARQPLLDQRLIELSWRLPLSMKVRQGVGKWALREVLAQYVPRPLWERPKMGFSIPLDSWLRGPLRSWTLELLNPDLLRRQGFFDAEKVTPLVERHMSGAQNLGGQLWTLLSFQSWYRVHHV